MITICYLEILLQVLFRIFFIPIIYWEGNNILARFDSIQSGMNLQYTPTGLNMRNQHFIYFFMERSKRSTFLFF